ncbi:hypothetical protein JZ751_017142 [Albula glossodonta]|uniref:Uncharacterized protein n=1 Tax=Albula glossodonta TaxID=121402 RepID=A0A8T2NX65_9TELE|nr:hypothetical protein JZ751_017142 [Albula glossodonta]
MRGRGKQREGTEKGNARNGKGRERLGDRGKGAKCYCVQRKGDGGWLGQIQRDHIEEEGRRSPLPLHSLRGISQPVKFRSVQSWMSYSERQESLKLKTFQSRQTVSVDEQEQREEQRKKKEGLFQRAGRFRRSTSPPSRTLSLSLSHGKHHESTLPSLDPSPSVTLLSLSSLSDCNSTKSLLPSDPDDPVLTPAGPAPCPTPSPALNPLLDLRAESFKREPNQSLTPTHVSAAMALNRGHRRTPSDGAIRPRAQTLGHRRTPSDGSAPLPPAPTPGLVMPHTGCRDMLEIPRLPDPSTIFPTAHRRKVPPPPPLDDGPASGTLERPKTLEFAPRPRPTPARARADPWRLGSLSRTLSSSPGSGCDSPLGSGDGGGGGGGDRGGAAQPTLLDMDTEGQSQDSTVPLCGQHVPPPTLCGQHFS